MNPVELRGTAPSGAVVQAWACGVCRQIALGPFTAESCCRAQPLMECGCCGMTYHLGAFDFMFRGHSIGNLPDFGFRLEPTVLSARDIPSDLGLAVDRILERQDLGPMYRRTVVLDFTREKSRFLAR